MSHLQTDGIFVVAKLLWTMENAVDSWDTRQTLLSKMSYCAQTSDIANSYSCTEFQNTTVQEILAANEGYRRTQKAPF